MRLSRQEYSVRIIAVLMVTSLLITGCGGGGGSGTTAVKINVAWGARSRDVHAPSSALSAVIKLKQAAPDGTDFSFTVNRAAPPAAYTQSYTSPTQAKTGTWHLIVRFYAQPDGAGDLVGSTAATITLHGDGSGIPELATDGAVASVTVNQDQLTKVGQSVSLTVTVQDAQGNLIAVSPGSVFPAVVNGAAVATVVNGQVQGVSPGLATVTATVDGITSSSVQITVLPAISYTITDLGGLPGFPGEIMPHAVNNRGQVVGSANYATSYNRAFLWQNGRMTDLGTFTFGDGTQYQAAIAYGLNDLGQVVGSAQDVAGHLYDEGFVWQNGSLNVLKGILPSFSVGYGINRYSQAVFYASNAPLGDIIQQGYIWTSTSVTPLLTYTNSPYQNYVIGYGINDNGVVAASWDHENSWYAAEWIGKDRVVDFGMGGSSYAINNKGQVAGNATDFSDRIGSAFIWQNGTTTYLRNTAGGNEIGSAEAINQAGDVVGRTGYKSVTIDQLHAALGQNGFLFDLNNFLPVGSGWELLDATGINDHGQIVGQGLHNGVKAGFILTPQ